MIFFQSFDFKAILFSWNFDSFVSENLYLDISVETLRRKWDKSKEFLLDLYYYNDNIHAIIYIHQAWIQSEDLRGIVNIMYITKIFSLYNFHYSCPCNYYIFVPKNDEECFVLCIVIICFLSVWFSRFHYIGIQYYIPGSIRWLSSLIFHCMIGFFFFIQWTKNVIYFIRVASPHLNILPGIPLLYTINVYSLIWNLIVINPGTIWS